MVGSEKRIAVKPRIAWAVMLIAVAALVLACAVPALADDGKASSSTSSSEAAEDGFTPVSDGGNAEKYLRDLKGDEAVEKATTAAEKAEEQARGHWEYEDFAGKESHDVQKAPAKPGNAIAVAATALSGYGRTKSIIGPTKGTTYEKRHTKPPNMSKYGNWRVYNKVMKAIPNRYVGNLYTDCSANVALAVWWSGVDDKFTGSNTLDQYKYMTNSSKWTRVGGSNKYFHRKTGKCDGFKLKPGDILVGKPCQTENRRTHIFIYTGTEISKMKYPKASYTIFESHMGKSWPGMQEFTPIPNATVDYCVFRRNGKDLDIEGSKYAKLFLDEKVKFSPEVGKVEEKAVERRAVRYVYTDYQINYLGIPQESTVGGPTTFRYDTETFKLADPLLPENVVFDGWYTDPDFGVRITEIPQHTGSDVTVYAHTHVDEIHTFDYHMQRLLEEPEAEPTILDYLYANPWVGVFAGVVVVGGLAVFLVRRRARLAGGVGAV